MIPYDCFGHSQILLYMTIFSSHKFVIIPVVIERRCLDCNLWLLISVINLSHYRGHLVIAYGNHNIVIFCDCL